MGTGIAKPGDDTGLYLLDTAIRQGIVEEQWNILMTMTADTNIDAGHAVISLGIYGGNELIDLFMPAVEVILLLVDRQPGYFQAAERDPCGAGAGLGIRDLLSRCRPAGDSLRRRPLKCSPDQAFHKIGEGVA